MTVRFVSVGGLALLAVGCSRPNPNYQDSAGSSDVGSSGTGPSTQATTLGATADGSGTQGQSGTTTATSSQTTVTADGSSGSTTDFEETGDPPPGFHPCCEGVGGPGCPPDPDLEICVCEVDDSCCQGSWGTYCGTLAVGWCEASCEYDCCIAHGAPGCADPQVEDTVCNRRGLGYCCESMWDDECVFSAIFDHGECMSRLGCCDAHDLQPGCNDPVVASCVCLLDPYCCVGGWDAQCVEEAIVDCGEC